MNSGDRTSLRFSDTLRRLLRRNAVPNIRKILARTHPADLSAVLNSFLPSERRRLLSYVGEDERQAEVIACLPLLDAVELVSEIPFDRSVALLRAMSADDRADILGALDEDAAQKILEALPDEESDEAADLMRYEETTAGGIMSPDFLSIDEGITAAEAILILQKSPEVEMAFYIYVINDHGSLVGVVSLRQLVTSKPDVEMRDIMNPHVSSVRTDEDQEEVARLVSRYDFLAIPVVDETNCLVGVVTVDDVIDVIREEATEDILKMAGVGEELDENIKALNSVKKRAPWLFAALIGGVVAAFVLGRYEEMLSTFPLLVGFVPVIIGMAGNVGTQSLTIIVRGLATRRIDSKHFWRVVGREVLVGILLGFIYGVVLGVVVRVVGHSNENVLKFALVISGSASLSMVMAALIGSATPMIFARLNIDPAVATGPFMTTTIDILGVLLYVNAAYLLL